MLRQLNPLILFHMHVRATNTFSSIMAHLFVLSTSWLGVSCLPEGACEIKIKVSNYYIYSCREGNTEETCSSSTGAERVFHEGASCSSLGYAYSDGNGAYTAEADSYRTPGSRGAYKDDLTTVVNCTGYDGPSFDIQIDSQCQTAYAYACSGYQPGVDAACAIYEAWQKDNPSIPDCPYCD